jgi:hypothetical protein
MYIIGNSMSIYRSGKFWKSSVSSVSGKLAPALAGSRRQGFLCPEEVVQGIHCYTKLAGVVYSKYRTTTRKYLGLALYDGTTFEPCEIHVLISALESEGK